MIDELINLELIEEYGYQENIYESVTFEFIQSHCNKDIEQFLKNIKTGIDDMELDEFQMWFGFNTGTFLKELNKKNRYKRYFPILNYIYYSNRLMMGHNYRQKPSTRIRGYEDGEVISI
ncbi:MAG: hypothetical protein ACPG44_06210 [Polaribacter sp.]